MNPVIREYPSLPSFGKRSPVGKVYAGVLKKAYYFTNLSLLIGITAVFGFIKYRAWQAERNFVVIPDHQIQIIDITKFTPPPLDPTNNNGQVTDIGVPKLPVLGIPVPVPDANAVNVTMPDQTDVTGQNVLPNNLNTNDTTKVLVQNGNNFVPDINAFVPVEVPAQPVNMPAPEYPSVSKIMGQEGTVWVKMLVNLDGTVMKVSVMKSSTFPLLDSAAVESGYKWKFAPAVQNHKPVRVWVATKMNFELK
jgi:TonB family protein